MSQRSTISGWGGHSVEGCEIRAENLSAAANGAALSRGLGRSYGDSSLPPDDCPIALNTTLADRILEFDQATGRLRAEAGLSLADMNRLLMPRGWFTPVSPGTQYVTLGGMVAADIHGKNQHLAGNFGHHVTKLRMQVADGRILECDSEQHADLFFGTIGGMGLTGHILEVECALERIPSPWIWQETQRIPNIDEFQVALEEAAPQWPYTVGWIDCVSRGSALGRGILMCGRWATADEAPKRVPPRRLRPRLTFDFPGWALGPWTVRAFNELYFRKQWRPTLRGIVHPESFFYPLDVLREWHRMYGTRGFTQYQCVLPHTDESGARKTGSARRVLDVLTTLGGASFLAVIKDFGQNGVGVLSFPRPGITLALDIPIRANTQALIDALNQVVIEEGGRIYLAKDSFTRRRDFERMDSRVHDFNALRDTWDPQRRFRSAQSVRLLGDLPRTNQADLGGHP